MRNHDRNLIPRVGPSPATISIMQATAAAIGPDVDAAVEAIGVAARDIVAELAASRIDGVLLSSSDLAEAMDRLMRVVARVEKARPAIQMLDPEHYNATAPVRREAVIRDQVSKLGPMPTPDVDAALKMHAAGCRDVACDTHEILRRAIAGRSAS